MLDVRPVYFSNVYVAPAGVFAEGSMGWMSVTGQRIAQMRR